MEKKKSNIIDLAAERERRKPKTKPAGKDLVTYTPGADAISLEDGYRIAQRVIKKYRKSGALLKDFIERRKKSEFRVVDGQEMHEVFAMQKAMAAACSTPDLKTVLGQHSLKPDHFEGVYILAVAEEFMKRFHGTFDGLPWR